MNKDIVKELTREGCIVAKEAAESLTEADVDAIRSLDSTPMYISEEMLVQLRKKQAATPNVGKAKQKAVAAPNGGSQVQKVEGPTGSEMEPNGYVTGNDLSEEVEAEGSAQDNQSGSVEDRDEGHGNNSSESSVTQEVKIMDDRDRRELRTKVEIIDEKEVSRSEKDVPEFLQYYNDRYEKMRKLLTRRMELQNATTINRLERRDEGEKATTVGLVKSKYSTNSSGKYIVELEDKTGTFKALVDEREGERIVPDEMIGVIGNMGEDIIYADSIIRADMPIPQGLNTTEQKVAAAYVSDLHMGSKDTMHDRLDKFGEWLSSSKANNIGYLVIPGDVVEGVGTYPGQEEELEVTDIYKQYQLLEEWVEKLPEDLQIIIGPGNHDIVRLAEPQPKLPEKALPNISHFNNVHLVQNPQMVRLHGIESKGIKNLMYHGYSFDDHADQIQELREKGYEEPHHIMIDLLKRRHLAPTYGSNSLSPEGEDSLVIDEEPDVFVSGHFHSHSNESYKGVNVICASTFQAQTDFQKRVGHEPDPGKVTIVDYKTRNTKVKKFV